MKVLLNIIGLLVIDLCAIKYARSDKNEMIIPTLLLIVGNCIGSILIGMSF